MADLVELYSNNSTIPWTPEGLEQLAKLGTERRPELAPVPRGARNLLERIDPDQRAEIIRRYREGASASSLARELRVAPSALLKLLRADGVPVRTKSISNEQAERMKEEYETGATVQALMDRHGLSHGAVVRALHRTGTAMRPTGRRRR